MATSEMILDVTDASFADQFERPSEMERSPQDVDRIYRGGENTVRLVVTDHGNS